MGITTTVAARKGKESREISRDTTANTNRRPRKNRRKQRKVMLPVQRLFDTCKEVFSDGGADIIPPPEDIERLKAVLDWMRPEDLGLSPEMSYFQADRAETPPPITYLHLYESEKFSMGIFCLPPSGVIPLHNHPGMTVFSKILFGTLHIKSYDWVAGAASPDSAVHPPQAESLGPRLAKVKVDSNFTAPCNTSILYPADGGNMHCFTAVTACAFLDVLGPPYSDAGGRPCTYYTDHPFSSISVEAGVSIPEEEGEGYAWLEERERPREISVVGDEYRGPMFVED